MINAKPNALKGKKISWISFLVLDRDLHKTSQLEVLKNLSQKGHKVSLFGIYTKKKYSEKTKGVQVSSVPLRYVSSLTAVLYTILMFVYLPFYTVFSKPDFIIVEPREPTFLSALSMIPIPKSMRPKIILDVRSTPVGREFSEYALFTCAIRTAKRFFDGITIITPMMRDEICERYNVDKKSVGVWTSGASTAIFNPRNFKKSELKKIFGFENKFVVFYHGALGPTSIHGQARGIAQSVRSLAFLKDNFPDVVLFLLGDSASFPWLRKLSEEVSVKEMVVLHEQVDYDQVPQYIAMCDAALVPLPDARIWRNQCSLKLLEYLAMEKVAVATDIPANRCVIDDSKCGVYIHSSEPKEIANGILYVRNNEDKLEEWGKLGRTIIIDKYSWKKVAEDFENYLLQLQ